MIAPWPPKPRRKTKRLREASTRLQEMRVSNRTVTDFCALYSHAGAPISEDDIS